VNDTLRLVFWELTARCNLTCKHCRAEAQDHFVKGELTTDEILGVAKDIRDCADPILILTGGEPLVRKDFFDIAEYCSGAMAGRIANCGIQRVSISLDGACADTHDAFRGLPGSFRDALQGMDALRKAGLPVQVNVTVAKHNIDEVEDILKLAIAHGADAFHMFVLVPVGCGVEISDEVRLAPGQMEDVLRWLFEKSLELRNRVHLKATCAPQYYRIMHQLSRERGIQVAGAKHGMHAVTRGCLAGSAVCFVSRVGDVQPCGYLPVRVGNVRDRKFADIWSDSAAFNALRDAGQLKGKCGACGFRKVCAGCRARAHADTLDFMAQDPDCVYVPPRLEAT